MAKKQCLEENNINQPFVTAIEYTFLSAYAKSLNIYIYILILSEPHDIVICQIVIKTEGFCCGGNTQAMFQILSRSDIIHKHEVAPFLLEKTTLST